MAARDLFTPVLSGGGTWRFPANEPLRLDSGGVIPHLEIGYQTYGALNAD
jgi:homoserine O-acetyltransferase